MKILLLSRCTGALAPFLAESTGSAASRLRIGYIDDAQVAFAEAPFVRAERDAVDALGHERIAITVRDMAADDFDRMLADLDAVYVASGSTFALLEALRISGCDAPLIRHVRAGLPYIGSSAGSIVAGPDITPASLLDDIADGPALTSFAGLALVEQTVIPHADGKLPPYPPKLISATLDSFGGQYPLVPLADDQALLADGSGTRVVESSCTSSSSHPEPRVSHPEPRVPTVLLTGFEPFGGHASNPSWTAVQLVRDSWAGDARLEVRQLPVDFASVDGALRAALAEVNPDIVISVGLAAGTESIRVERIAINVDDARIPDNSGYQPIDEPVVDGGPAGYFSTLPIKGAVAAIRAKGIQAVVSQTAGTYTCNHVFYLLMHELRQRPGTRGGFVHIPHSHEEAPGTDSPSLALERLTTALTAVVEAALSNETDVKVGGGTLD
ncbi:pyroglutamyl-peptidase I [Pseudoclavibacter sp. AY1F1]|uniref:pyroglutamyl-peptidase I n=1 Tax=Pseudoclavibacter sp. AY1F1 TaxID=2080583 RepID=UPI0015E2AB2F|nr:pyroglutamyl-peptidase I [Pseudoclavibacter sp. AY1F1]